MRPTPALAGYATPVTGLSLGGAGTHPGGGVMAAAGHNATLRVLRDGRRARLRARLRPRSRAWRRSPRRTHHTPPQAAPKVRDAWSVPDARLLTDSLRPRLGTRASGA
jgi:hypothetical protein